MMNEESLMLRYLTAGESHGPALTAIVEGFPSGVALDTAPIDRELERRQGGYGRGKRQKLETDRIIVDSGVYHGVTTGGPITLRLINNDAKLERLAEPAAPRGGHIDLAGAINYQTGIRQVLERASARETALARRGRRPGEAAAARAGDHGLRLRARAGRDRRAAAVVRPGGPRRQPGLHAQPRGRPGDRRGDRRGARGRRHAGRDRRGDRDRLPDRPGQPRPVGPQARRPARRRGDEHPGDQGRRDRPGRSRPPAGRARRSWTRIQYDPDHPPDDRRFGFRRPTNNAGGIEGGTSNGEPIVVRAAKKPISTLAARGPSINMATKAPQPAAYERSDVCAVPAASVIVENVVAFEIAAAVVEKYVGTSLEAIRTAHDALHALNRERLAHWGESGERLEACPSELSID